MNIDMIIFILFILVILALVIKDRKNIKFQSFVLMRKTKRGRRFIDNIAKAHPVFWKRYSAVAVAMGFIVMIIFTALISYSAYEIVSGSISPSGGIVLPYPTSKPLIGSGYILLPIWLWLLAIAIIIIPHEFSHGIVARIEKIRIKSLGWLLFIIVPGAFVEPDEKQLKKSPRSTRLRIYSAGSFANLCTFAVFLVILFGMSYAIINTLTPYGVTYSGIINGTGAYNKNLSGVITSLDRHNVIDIEEFLHYMSNKTVGDNVTVGTNTGNYTITLVNGGNKALIGISGVRTAYYSNNVGDILLSAQYYLYWIMLLVLFVGMVNLLPIKPLDGGYMLETLLEKYTKKNKKIVNIISVIVVIILILNIVSF